LEQINPFMMKSIFIYILSLVVLLAPAGTMAAFEFTPSDQPAPAMTQRDDIGMDAGDQPDDQMEGQATDPSAPTPVNVNDIAPPVSAQPLPSAPSMQEPDNIVPAQRSTTMENQPASPTNFKTVEGFASDIPMILALREIVPNDYGFSFAKGIDLGQRISWEGGRIWPAILEDVLAPADLDFRISGKIVRIEPAGSQTQSMTQMATGPSFIQEEIQRRRAQREQAQQSPSTPAEAEKDTVPAMELAPPPPKSLQPSSRASDVRKKTPRRDRIATLLRDDRSGSDVIGDIDETNLSNPPAEIRQRVG
jgi:hypothetical protein